MFLYYGQPADPAITTTTTTRIHRLQLKGIFSENITECEKNTMKREKRRKKQNKLVKYYFGMEPKRSSQPHNRNESLSSGIVYFIRYMKI